LIESNVKDDISKNIRKTGFIILTFYIIAVFLVLLLDSFNLLDFSETALNNQVYAPPSISHLCGTDRLGRDVCLRTLQGSTIAFEVVFLSLFFSLLVGLPLGLISGYFGGYIDKFLSIVMDTIFSIPVILLSVVIAFILGRGVINAALALCIVYSPQYFRLIRNQTLLIKSENYVEAANISGVSTMTVIIKYIFPNVITPLPVLLTLNAADAVLVLGSLGFLGLGVPASVPEWGSDLNLALTALPTGIWWTALYPGFAMFFLVLALSFIGEDLDESFNK